MDSLNRTRKNSCTGLRSIDFSLTPKQLLSADMFGGASPDVTPSLRRVRSMPMSPKNVSVLGTSVPRMATLANASAETPTKGKGKQRGGLAFELKSAAVPEVSVSIEEPESAVASGAANPSTTSDTSDVGKLEPPTTGPVTRSSSLQALMADAEVLAELDLAELMRQEEMLAALREQVARALTLKRAKDVGVN